MKKYKIEVKEILAKEIIVNAENEEKAFDFIEKILLKTNILDLENNSKNLQTIELAVKEVNGEKLKENLEDFDEDFEIEKSDNYKCFK